MFTHTNKPIFLSDRDRLLNEMLAVQHITFHLTGSRYFGNATDASDWDFFVEALPLPDNGLTQWLKSVGFNIMNNSQYTDSQTLVVWRHPCGIDVQEVKNARVKLAAQTILRSLFESSAGKLSPGHWNAANCAASEILNKQEN